ncbi:MAG: hypothetical protein KIT84_27995 [Labilithrix sp.]|nr:hypothetical protein [Labilithrix sp.]MCW5814901.1 hypothetical protein [Labilithrix sp.]
MRFFHNAPIIIVTVAFLVIAAITGVGQLLTSRLVHSAHEGDYELMRDAFVSQLKSFEDEAASDAELVANVASVRKAFAARDRAALQAETIPMFKVIEAKYAMDQAAFHTPPGVTFLRLHAPDKFGDDQTPYRPMLSEAQHEKALRKGTAITKNGPAIFAIVPVLDDKGQFVGTFEMGLEFGPVLKDLKTAYGIEGAVYFEEKTLREIATDIEPEVMIPKNRFGKYMRYYATHPELMSTLVGDKDVDITEGRRYERMASRAPWGVHVLPVYNYANKQIGVVALATSFAADKSAAGRALVWQMLAGLVGIVIVGGAVIISIRGLLLAPLSSLTERMKELASGAEARPADPAEDYCDELRVLADCYEKLRGKRS